jgi:alanine-synthesizing transaminase
MEFRRIDALPPYVFAQINDLKIAQRHIGHDIVDLGFGNPDLPSPDIAVEKLCEAAQNPKNHRYSTSKGIKNLRVAVSALYDRTFDVKIDPETQVCMTIGVKEGFSHLMWTLLGPGDSALVPSPSYPIHIWGPILAGAAVHYVHLGDSSDVLQNMAKAYEQAWPRPRIIVASFPHNPTTTCVDFDFMVDLVAFAKERDMIVVHDFAYGDMGFDGYKPPSILSVPGAMDNCVELYSMTKSFSMAGWRCGFLLGNEKIIAALGKLKSYLDYGMFQPVQIAATVTMNELPDYPKEACQIYQNRRDALVEGLSKIGWEIEKPKATMFVWANIPESYSEMSSIEFCEFMIRECNVAVSPGAGFGPGGEGKVRFALVENEQRIHQAIKGLKKGLTKLG